MKSPNQVTLLTKCKITSLALLLLNINLTEKILKFTAVSKQNTFNFVCFEYLI